MSRGDFFQMIGAVNGILYSQNMCYKEREVCSALFPFVLLIMILLASVLVVGQN